MNVIDMQKKERYKLIVVLMLVIACFFLTYYFHAVSGISVVFSHFFYVPIILSSLWWQRKGVVTAVILAGMLIVFSHLFLREGSLFASDYIRAVMFIVVSLVVALLAEEIERRSRRLAALSSISAALSSSMELEGKIKAAVTEMLSSLKADGVSVFISGEDEHFILWYSRGVSEKLNHTESSGDICIGNVARSGKTVIYRDIRSESDGSFASLVRIGIRSLAYIPVRIEEEKARGVIRIESKTPRAFTPAECDIFGVIGGRVGVAVESAIFYDKYKKSEEKYRSLFDSDPNPIFILNDRSFRIMDVNRRAEEYYEYSRDELIGLSFLRLGDDDEEIKEALRNLSPDQSILISKKRHYRKGRSPFYVNINVSHAQYSEGYALIATTTDVSESITRDAQLIQASKMTTLGTMAAGMAHEINQPLNVIQVGADFLLKKVRSGKPIKDEEFETVAREISDNVQRAAQIITHMRDFSRKSEVIGDKLDINKPIRDVFRVLGQQLRVHQIELKLDLEEHLPPIRAEHNRMEQVFMNLVTNAMDAMDERRLKSEKRDWWGALTITSFYDDEHIVVTVTDTGIGIPDEIIDRIFEPFFTTKEVGKGTGLGTSISYGIVKDYGGTIEVTSEVNVGTTFTLKFPPCRDDDR
jgi:PAS domain S-box-containing protein